MIVVWNPSFTLISFTLISLSLLLFNSSSSSCKWFNEIYCMRSFTIKSYVIERYAKNIWVVKKAPYSLHTEKSQTIYFFVFKTTPNINVSSYSPRVWDRKLSSIFLWCRHTKTLSYLCYKLDHHHQRDTQRREVSSEWKPVLGTTWYICKK